MVGTTNIGLTYKPTDISDRGTIVLRSCNIKNGKIDLDDLVRVNTPIKENQYIENNDILICARNGSRALVGKCALLEDIQEKTSFGAFMAVFRTECYRYLYYYFNTSFFRSFFDSDDSKQINQVTQATLRDSLIPLPPFSEQVRITEQLETTIEVLDLINERVEATSEIISHIKSKILDLAIQGKLVPQNPEDEPAAILLDRIRAEKEELIKAGKIKRDKKESVIFKGEDNSYYEKVGNNIKNIADKIPFEIPESWTFVRLEDILDYEQPTPYIVKSIDYKDDYQTPVLTAGKSFIIGYTNETYGIKTELPVIIFDDFTTDSKYVDFPFKVKSSAMKILTAKEKLINTKFAYYAMQVVECDNYNHKRYWISEFSKKLIPLPPKNEQVKIVNAIEELYKYIEQSLN